MKVSLDWDLGGLRLALTRKDLVVIVDVCSFSTAVVEAISNGYRIYPVGDKNRREEMVAKIPGAVASGSRGKARYSLSPLSYAEPGHGQAVVLYSPNGAACSELIGPHDTGLIGCFLNATAVAAKATALAKTQKKNITVIAANEQRAITDGERLEHSDAHTEKVFAMEDYLASGAIISGIKGDKNVDAQLAAESFQHWQNSLLELLTESTSGRYLIQRGFAADLKLAAQLNSRKIVPIISDGAIS